MTQQERARIAFKALGLVFLAITAGAVLVRSINLLTFSSVSVHDGLASMASRGITLGPFALIGFLCLVWAQSLARALLPTLESEAPWPFEFVRGGVCLMGVWFLYKATADSLQLASSSRLGMEFDVAVSVALALGFVGAPTLIGKGLVRWARSPSSTAEAGAVLLLLWIMGRGLADALRWVGSGLHYGALPVSPELGMLLRAASYAALILLALVAGVFAAGLCRRYATGRDSSLRPRALARLAPATLLGAAIAIGVFCRFFSGGWPRPFPALYWDLPRFLVREAVFPLVAVAILWAMRFVAWPLGRRLSGNSTPSQDVEASSARLAIEVALVVLALWGVERAIGFGLRYLPSALASSGWFTYLLGSLTPLVGWCVLLAFKGDLAWLCGPRRMPAQEPLPAVRADLLQPWMFLLGLWFVVKGSAGIIAWVTAAAVTGWWDAGSYGRVWEAGFGLALILGAGWLSGRFSYGRLLPAIGRWLAAVGKELTGREQ